MTSGIILDLVVRLVAVCCPMPLFDQSTPAQGETAFDAGTLRIWACFAAGMALLTLTFWSAVWLALALLR